MRDNDNDDNDNDNNDDDNNDDDDDDDDDEDDEDEDADILFLQKEDSLTKQRRTPILFLVTWFLRNWI